MQHADVLNSVRGSFCSTQPANMTVGHGNTGAPVAPRASLFVASVKLQKDVTVLSLKQPVDATDGERQAYNSAYRQCWGHLMSHPPKGFNVNVSGGIAAPFTEVTVREALLAKLPLLKDVSGSTSADDPTEDSVRESEPAAPRVTSMSLPCSVWGFVSLLVLLEGSIGLKSWFSNRTDADPSLPAQTLEVRCFGNVRSI
jgi:hypothetical protein